MTTIIRLALCILVATAPAWLAARAADPVPATGHVLLLDNEGTLEGDVERVGEQYRVRRPHGETWVPAEKALGLCASLEDAYALLRRRANLDDADERLRLARWCHLHGLRSQALAEVTAAVQLRPDQPEGRRLLAGLRQSASASAPPPAARAEAEPGPAALPPDLAAESLCAFRTRVQPILMNACAGCHATGRGGSFKLLRVYDDGGNRQTVQRNVAAVLAQVNLKAPQGSPLLTKAVSAHDGRMAQAPLRGREAPAYRALETWVQEMLTENPQLQERTPPVAEAKEERPPGPPAGGERTPSKETRPATEPPPARPQPVPESSPARFVPASRPQDPVPQADPQAQQTPADPFDPAVFNREMHPARKGAPGR